MKLIFMRRIYIFFLYLCTPLLILRLFWKGRRLSAYRDRIHERFTIGVSAREPIDVWIHAVSLGEVNTASGLIDELLARGLSVLVTTMTPTGSQQVQSVFKTRVSHQYLPYDLPLLLRRFFKATRPKLGIIMETELWPNLIYEANRRNLPLFIANSRISDGAFNKYMKMRFLFKPVLNKLTGIIAQSESDAVRFVQLGAHQDIVSVAGNLKFDWAVSAVECPQYSFKKAWGDKRPVLLAASTHDNEEEQLLLQLSRLQSKIPNILLVIAPRHPERFTDVYQLSCKMGFKTGLRSNLSSIQVTCEVVVIDSLGELTDFYTLCDYAFIGGSLVPIGGHNLLEPIALHIPVFTGPYNHNAKSICKTLVEAKAIQVAANGDVLIDLIHALHQNQFLKNEQVANANRILLENKGSLQRHLQELKPFFEGYMKEK